MKLIKLILFFVIIFSLFTFPSCKDEKDNEEKHALVIVNHSYNKGSLQVTIENKNDEKVTVELMGSYKPSAMDTKLNYIQEKVKVEALEVVRKEFSLSGEMPTNMSLTYKVY